MRASRTLLATAKETPADAVVISHKLMLRAGMVRKLASGLYTWLPSGLRVLQKVEKIIRSDVFNTVLTQDRPKIAGCGFTVRSLGLEIPDGRRADKQKGV